jgi:hypothetical protein
MELMASVDLEGHDVDPSQIMNDLMKQLGGQCEDGRVNDRHPNHGLFGRRAHD